MDTDTHSNLLHEMLHEQGESEHWGTKSNRQRSKSAFGLESLGDSMDMDDAAWNSELAEPQDWRTSSASHAWLNHSDHSASASPPSAMDLQNLSPSFQAAGEAISNPIGQTELNLDELIMSEQCGPSIDASALQLTNIKREPVQALALSSALTAHNMQIPVTASDSYSTIPFPSAANSPSTNYQSCRSSSSPQPQASTSAVPATTEQPYDLLVLGLPDTATRTRVETQIKLSLLLVQNSDRAAGRLTNRDGDLIPEAAERASRIGDWTYLRLPSFAAIKKKTKKNQVKCQILDEETLFMEANVVKGSGEIEEVLICENCRQREIKRSQRKRSSKAKSEGSNAGDDDAEQVNSDPRRILLFNCGEYVDFGTGEVTLPTRIACYCRHHGEKSGFKIQFILRDHLGNEVARTLSPRIFTTDDHKARPRSANTSRNNSSENLAAANGDASISPVQLNLKRKTPASRSGQSHPQEDKKSSSSKPYDATKRPRKRSSSISRSSQFAMTPLQSRSPNASYIALPDLVSPSQHHFSPSNGFTPMFNTNPSGDTSTPSSPGASVESFSSLMGSSATSYDTYEQPGDSMLLHSTLSSAIPLPQTQLPSTQPRISKLIPGSGPMMGGIEVTILGENFNPNLICVFGDSPAIPTQMWSANTLVCILPPSASPGPVMVSFKNQALDFDMGGSLQLFTYLDTTDRALLELALQVIGLKMSGRVEGARDIAMRIIGQSQAEMSGGSSSNGQGYEGSARTANTLNGQSATDRNLRSQTSERPSARQYPKTFEGTLLRLLSLLSTDVRDLSPTRLSKREALSLCTKEGHTLLHLATILGFHRLVDALIKDGAPLDKTDRNGFTALHFAALYGRVAAARLLIDNNAATFLRTSLGRTAQDIARQRDQTDITALFPSRSASDTTLTRSQSRQSSRTSLRSFFSSDRGGQDSDNDSDSSDDGSYSGDAESGGSDIERRISRNPSSVSLPAEYAQEDENEEDGTIIDAHPAPAKKSNKLPTPAPSLFDVASAYSAWLADALTPQTKLPDWSKAKMQMPASVPGWEKVPAAWEMLPTFPIAAFPVNTPNVDPRTWFWMNEDKGKGKEGVAEVPQFWRPFDQYFRGSKVTEVQAQDETVPLYPPAPQEHVQQALAPNYAPEDLTTSVRQAVAHSKEKCKNLKADRRLFLIWLPAILLAMAYFVYIVDLSSISHLLSKYNVSLRVKN